MRAPLGAASGDSATPIYDSLYAEYRRLFRALPGDRSGEDELRFEGFDALRGTGTGAWGDAVRQHTGERRRAQPAALPPAPRDGERYGG